MIFWGFFYYESKFEIKKKKFVGQGVCVCVWGGGG